MTSPGNPVHWTEAVYRDNARLLYDVEAALFQNKDLTRQELAAVEALARRMGRVLDSPILDIACGPGRHAIQLANAGHDVTGVDFSPGLLALARESAAANRNGSGVPSFITGDMRQLEFDDGAFDTVMVLGNSFGYFSEDDNRRALSEASRVLSDGGFLCLEMTNKEKYLATFEAVAEEFVEGRFYPGLKCEWHKSWDPASRRITTYEKHSVADTGEVLYEGPYDVRLFDEHEIVELLQSLGLVSVTCLPFSPGKEMLGEGLGDTFGALGEALFVGATK